MNPLSVLGVYREQVFSPGKVQDDAAILDATLAALSRIGYRVASVKAEFLDLSTPRPGKVLSMAQSGKPLAVLDEWQQRGTRVVNSVESILNCYRKPLTRLLTEAGVCMPSSRMMTLEEAEQGIDFQFPGRIWLKRGDVHAMQSGDVIALESETEVQRALDHYRRHGIGDILLQDHVEGHVVKFYGIGTGEYFRAYLAATGEDITSRARPLVELAVYAAQVVGLEIYGGDAVLTDEDEVLLIDLNDWPSFSRCCKTAAESIASYLVCGN